MSSYFFGFLPSENLNSAIDEAFLLINQPTSEPFYIHRNKITHLVNKELLDVMLVQLIDNLPSYSERKTHLMKTCQLVETTADKMINGILDTASNQEVLSSFDFLKYKTLFTDNSKQRRIGFLLDDELSKSLLMSFSQVKQGYSKEEIANLSHLFSRLSKACLHHFVLDFTTTLPLGKIKRSAVSIAHSVMAKGIDLAIHRLLPQLPHEGVLRLVNYYENLIFQYHKP